MYQSSKYKGCLSKCNPNDCQFYDKSADEGEIQKTEAKRKYKIN